MEVKNKTLDIVSLSSTLSRNLSDFNQSPKRSAVSNLFSSDNLLSKKPLVHSNPLPRKIYTTIQSSPKRSLPQTTNNAVFVGSHLSLPESSVYTSTVSIPSYYTEQKQLQKGTSKSTVLKLSGVPFAIIYGFALYIILGYMIFSDQHQHPVFNQSFEIDLTDNLCRSNLTHKTNNTRNRFFIGSHFSGYHRKELVYATVSATVCVGIASYFSRNTRSTMLLILPGLITSRSRTFLFTFILAILCNGPISSIRYNFNAIMKNAACMYESVLRATCHNGKQANEIFQKFEAFFNEILELEKKFNELSKGGFIDLSLKININPNVTWPNFQDLINAPPMNKLKDQISKAIIQVSNILKYSHLGGKFLTIISIILMIIDAIGYIRKYYSDSSFDNMFISDRVRNLWKEKGCQVLTPLRHWEINEGYKVRNTPRFSNKEFYKIIRQLIPTSIFSVIAVLVISADILLARTLRYIKDIDEQILSFDGVQQNYTNDLQLVLPSYNISADTCLVPPVLTSDKTYIIVSLVLLGAGISCILEVYLSRIRSRMCNVFYPDKEMERADYLHYRIQIGRINRKFQLSLIVRRELERRAKLIRFSPLARLKKFISRNKSQDQRTFVCPACDWKAKCLKAKTISFCLGESEINDKICYNCHLDLLNNVYDDRKIQFSAMSNYGTC